MNRPVQPECLPIQHEDIVHCKAAYGADPEEKSFPRMQKIRFRKKWNLQRFLYFLKLLSHLFLYRYSADRYILTEAPRCLQYKDYPMRLLQPEHDPDLFCAQRQAGDW